MEMKGIKAKVTVFDEENGLVLIEDRLIAPYREDFDPNLHVTSYEFRFEFKRIESCKLVRSVKEATDEELQEILKGEEDGIHEA